MTEGRALTLAAHRERCVACGIGTNPARTGTLCPACWPLLDSDLLRDVASPTATSDPAMWRRAAAHPNLDPELATAFLWVDDRDTLAALATNPATPDDALAVLCEHPSEIVRLLAGRTRHDRARAADAAHAMAAARAAPVPFAALQPAAVRGRWDSKRAAIAGVVCCVAVGLVAFVAGLTVRGSRPVDPPAVTPAVTAAAVSKDPGTTVPATPVKVGDWAATTGPALRPRVWTCGPGQARVRVMATSAPLELWVSGERSPGLRRGGGVILDHPGGPLAVAVHGAGPTTFDLDVACPPP